MSFIERQPQQAKIEDAREVGDLNYGNYKLLANLSNVPSSFHEISMSWKMKSGLSTKEVAGSLLGLIFEDELDADKALKYAEAMAAVKRLDEMVEDGEDIEYARAYREAKFSIGRAEIASKNGVKPMESIMEEIEAYFSNPNNGNRLKMQGSVHKTEDFDSPFLFELPKISQTKKSPRIN